MLLQFSIPKFHNRARINKETVRHLEFKFQRNRSIFTNVSTTVTLSDNNRRGTHSLYNAKRCLYLYHYDSASVTALKVYLKEYI
jgi:hypothetical protein